MPLMVPAPKGATGWGRSFMDFALSMKSLKEQKASRLAEQKSKDMYYDILGRQVSLAEKKQDYLEELEAEYGVAKYSALADEQQTRLLRMKIDVYKDMSDDELKTIFTADEVLKQMRASNIALRDESESLKQHISMQDLMRRQLESTRKGIASEVDAIYSADNLPADLKIQYGREMKQALMGQVEGKFDPATMRTPVDIRADIRDAITTERSRALKDELTEKKRVEDARTKEIRERAAEWPPPDKTTYEYGSFLEIDLAFRNRQDPPEVRYVHYDPAGWGVWERKGIPPAYQKAGNKLMTESRAKALGVHDKWLTSGGRTVAPQDEGSAAQELMWLRWKQLSPDVGSRVQQYLDVGWSASSILDAAKRSSTVEELDAALLSGAVPEE